jgi:glycosyltransferase involved in cell wall biosynthesis
VHTLLESDLVGRLVVANAMRSASTQLALRLAGRRNEAFPRTARHTLVSPMRLMRGEPVSPASARRLGRLYDARLRAAARRKGLVDPVVITCNAFVAGFSPMEWARAVTYYARDDWAAMPSRVHQRAAYLEAYESIRERKVRVAAVSETLLHRIAPTAEAVVVPNGVSEGVALPERGEPYTLTDMPHPRIAYAGTIDSRLDAHVVARIAAAYPEGSVVLAGPAGNGHEIEQLTALRNVHHIGYLDQASLAAMLQHVDVAVMPHRRSELTEAMSPLKIMDYLAAGRPVVATELAPVGNYDNRVVLVPDGGDWPAAVARAIAIGPASSAQRCAFIAANSWRVRHEALLGIALA